MSHQPSPSAQQRSKQKPALGITAGAEDVKYHAKYKELKKKVKEIEADNDRLHFKVLQAKRNIQRMKLERAILYERLTPSPDEQSDYPRPNPRSLPSLDAPAVTPRKTANELRHLPPLPPLPSLDSRRRVSYPHMPNQLPPLDDDWQRRPAHSPQFVHQPAYTNTRGHDYTRMSRSGTPDAPSRPDSRGQYYDQDHFRLRPVHPDDIEYDSRSRDRGFLPPQSETRSTVTKRHRPSIEDDVVYLDDRGPKRYHRDHDEDARMRP